MSTFEGKKNFILGGRSFGIFISISNNIFRNNFQIIYNNENLIFDFIRKYMIFRLWKKFIGLKNISDEKISGLDIFFFYFAFREKIH